LIKIDYSVEFLLLLLLFRFMLLKARLKLMLMLEGLMPRVVKAATAKAD